AAWQGQYDSYWFMTLMPSAVLTVAWLFDLVPVVLIRRAAALGLLVVAIATQPARIAAAPGAFPMDEYGVLVRASRPLVAGPPVRRIAAPFLPPTASADFVFKLLGGVLRDDAPAAAEILRNGQVAYHQ